MSLLLPLILSAHAERRYAIVIGSNQGDISDPILSFAEDDARRITEVLQDLGQVPPDAIIDLYHPDANRVRNTLQSLATRIQNDPGDDKVVLFVYYSGHADASDLHLAGSHLPLQELRDRVLAIDANVRVLVVDACRAGELTRLKGGIPIAPFTIVAAAPTASDGLAIMTSAAVGEDAQESDRLKGGVFTHHFVAGLRGAADTSEDGRVTLQESYHYAYTQTLITTSQAPELQHPSFSLDLRGYDDLVLTHLDDPGQNGQLSFAEAGDYLLFDARGQNLVMEAYIAPGGSLVVPAGDYLLRRRTSARLYEGRLEVPAQSTIAVPELEEVAFGQATRRGGQASSAIALRLGGGIQGPLINALPAGPWTQIGLQIDTAPITLIGRLNATRSWNENTSLSLTTTTLSGEVGAFKIFDTGHFSYGLGVVGGTGGVFQQFQTTGQAEDRKALNGWIGAVLRAEWAFSSRFSLGIECAENAVLFPEDSTQGTTITTRVVPHAALDLGIWLF